MTETSTAANGLVDSTVSADLDVLELAAHLRMTVARLARLLRQLDTEGLSPTQGSALVTIERVGPITLGSLATIERVAKPTVSAVAGKLEERGYVRRLDDPVDGRICRVELTAAGRDYLVGSRSRRTAWLVDRLDQCSSEEIAHLSAAVSVLDRLSERPAVMS